MTPQPGDIVFSYETRLGEAALIPEGLRCCLGRRMALMRPDTSKVDPRFLLYAYLGPYFQEVIRARTVHGSTVDRIPLVEFPSFLIRVPDLPTQRAIAHILGTLDDKIELNRRLSQTLEEVARTLFTSWFVSFDPVRAKAAGRRPDGMDAATAALFPSSFQVADEVELPTGWSCRALADLVRINDRTLRSGDHLDWIEYVDISNVVRGNIASVQKFVRGSEPGRARRRLRHGDTVLSTVRPDRGSYFLVLHPSEHLIASTGFAVLTPRAVPWGLVHCAATQPEMFEYLGHAADGGAYPAVRPELIGKLQVALPVDAAIATCFQRIAEPLFELAHSYRAQSKCLAEVRDELLPRLVSGEDSVLRLPARGLDL